VNLIIFIQVLKSCCYWTECLQLTLLIRRPPIPKRASGARLLTHWRHWLHSAEWGQKIFARSARKLVPTLSFKMLPLLLNVVHEYFSKSC